MDMVKVHITDMDRTNEKRIVDLEKLTPNELLEELVDRLIDHEESGTRLSEWVRTHDYDSDGEFNEEYDNLKTDHDEDWCRVREVVRFVKGDDTLWQC